MQLNEFMGAHAPRAGYTGYLFGEDWLLALDTQGGAVEGEFLVARAGLRRLEAGFETAERTLFDEKAGPFSQRGGLRRFFLLEGDRRLDDPLQQQLFSHRLLYAKNGEAAMRYLFFCLRDGAGERGQLLPFIERDAGGAPGENTPFRLRLTQTGELPQAYRWPDSLSE
ncbi:MAG: hypothetical protein HFG27_09990 [Provencibacterium sp.]|jgi:hypothetical protein|nr:hypothetical protein [Provencibacterium sp.]